MNYVSLFTGIGGFDLAFDCQDFNCVMQVERDPFATKVLNRHWPNVPKHDDVTTFTKDMVDEPVDIVCGGFPCQDLSVAGKREGLDGERSGLWYQFHRIIFDLKPRWCVIENVPGLLSSGPRDEFTRKTRKGIDFSIVLAGLTGRVPQVPIGGWRNSGFMQGRSGFYNVAWRVLDAQYFGVPQRRRRVFIVGSLGDGSCATILFNPESLSWDSAKGRGNGGYIAGALRRSIGDGGPDDNRAQANHLVVGSLVSHQYKTGGISNHDVNSGHIVVGALTARQRYDHETETFVFESRYARNGRGAPDTVAPPLKAENGKSGKGDGAPLVSTHGLVRRLTPVEHERLQGFPDGWTEWGMKDGERVEISDSQRYKQTGNAVAVPVVEWIASRIKEEANKKFYPPNMIEGN